MSESSLRRTILGYVNRGEKVKLCLLDIFLKKEKLSEYEAREPLARYYPIKLYNITKVYNELKSDGIILYSTTSGKDQFSDKETFIKVWEELKFAIEPLLVREVWGRGDVVKTLDEHQTYLIKKLIERSGTATREDILSDISRDIFIKSVPSYYNNSKLEDSFRNVDNQLADLMKSGYIRAIPSGYHVPDFVLFDFLGDMAQAQEILSILSKDLWMAFQFEPYLSEVRELREGHEKMVDSILAAAEQFNRDLYNDALDSLGVACEELSALIYRKIFKDEKAMPSSSHGRIMNIWNERHLWKDNPELEEPGKNAAIFLSSAMYIPKWMRDKTSHRLVRPTADAIRLSLASLLVAIDVSRKLNLLE